MQYAVGTEPVSLCERTRCIPFMSGRCAGAGLVGPAAARPVPHAAARSACSPPRPPRPPREKRMFPASNYVLCDIAI